MRFFSKIILVVLLAQAFAVRAETTPPAPAKALLPVELFFSNSKMGEAELSPDGKSVAITLQGSDWHDGVMALYTHDFTAETQRPMSPLPIWDAVDTHWIDNERLILTPATRRSDKIITRGTVAMDRDGSKQMNFGRKTFFFDVDQSGSSGDVFLLAAGKDNYPVHQFLFRVNSRSGKLVKEYEFPRDHGSVFDVVLDMDGEPRAVTAFKEGIETVLYRDRETDKWRKIAANNGYKGETFTPQFIGADDTLYISTRKDRDTTALYRYDVHKDALEAEPLIAIAGYDYETDLFGRGGVQHRYIVDRSQKKLLGIRFESDAPSTLWLDDKMKGIQQAVDRALPGTVNLVSVASGGSTERVLVGSFSDVQPSMYLVYETATGKLSRVGASHPDIDPKQMSHQDQVHYKARDGLDIPAYLTVPLGSNGKNLPLVVLVHGGPNVRGASWGWDPEVQFLASRGYAVLQPEFRGSTGFGFKHFSAGWKQWGLAMQDDIADGAHWAIDQGIADPARICIAGASYGGYAVLMGLVKNPELFRCGVEWLGVTDISALFDTGWFEDPDAWQRFGGPILVGDPKKDAEQFRQTSPVHLAEKIKAPLLMAYGDDDERVPLSQGRKMRMALWSSNSKMEWVVYDEEGHGWTKVKTRVDFWTRVEKFLKANIGTASTGVAKAAQDK